MMDADSADLAAVLYGEEDDVDSLLAGFAADLAAAGVRLGGVVQRNAKFSAEEDWMSMIDLLSGRRFSICLPDPGRIVGCKLDPAGMTVAAEAVGRAAAGGCDLIVVNKFSKQEAAGKGLRAELGLAIASGTPVLTAVSRPYLDSWREFAGPYGRLLPCDRAALAAWWSSVQPNL